MGLEVWSNMAWEITNWPPTNHILTTYQPPTNHIPIMYRPPTDHLPTTYRPRTDHVPTPTDHLPTTYQPPTDHLPTIYRPPTDHLPTTYRPPTNHLPTTNHFFKVQLVQYFPWLGFLCFKKTFVLGAVACQTRERLFEELKITKCEKTITVTILSSYLGYTSYFEPLFRPLEKPSSSCSIHALYVPFVLGNFVLMGNKDEKLIPSEKQSDLVTCFVCFLLPFCWCFWKWFTLLFNVLFTAPCAYCVWGLQHIWARLESSWGKCSSRALKSLIKTAWR